MGCTDSKPNDKYQIEVDPKAVAYVPPKPQQLVVAQETERHTRGGGGKRSRGAPGRKQPPARLVKRSQTVPLGLGTRGVDGGNRAASIGGDPATNHRMKSSGSRSGNRSNGSDDGANGKATGKLDWLGKDLQGIESSKLALSLLEVEDPPIGRGGCGHVRLVRAKGNGKFYALKCVEKRSVVKHNDIRHLRSEKEVLKMVSGLPFFVQLYGTFQDPYYCYFLMEYAVGGELFTQLHLLRRFSEPRARFYTCEVLLALESLHAQHVMFRDLKPENLLLDERGHIKVTDFGFAKELEPNGRCYSRIGTPHYLSPEILDKNSKDGYCISADWWAFACLVYELLAGKSAWGTAKSNKHEVLIRIIKGRYSIPRFFSPQAKSLCKAMMTHNFNKRLTSVLKVKEHPFFEGIDWTAVREQRLKVPHRPRVNFPGDRGNFDSFPVTHASQKQKVAKIDEALFDNF